MEIKVHLIIWFGLPSFWKRSLLGVPPCQPCQDGHIFETHYISKQAIDSQYQDGKTRKVKYK